MSKKSSLRFRRSAITNPSYKLGVEMEVFEDVLEDEEGPIWTFFSTFITSFLVVPSRQLKKLLGGRNGGGLWPTPEPRRDGAGKKAVRALERKRDAIPLPRNLWGEIDWRALDRAEKPINRVLGRLYCGRTQRPREEREALLAEAAEREVRVAVEEATRDQKIARRLEGAMEGPIEYATAGGSEENFRAVVAGRGWVAIAS